ncbi:MAG: hypothetical protein R3Y50_06065 [Rikenellaceae bacterium]
MAVLNLGKIEVGVQSGTAGTHEVGVKYTTEHTGRSNYTKQFRGVAGDASAVATVTIAGAAQSMQLLATSDDVAWDAIVASVTVRTNSEKFRVSTTSEKAITLKSASAYTVNELVGTFTSTLGKADKHEAVISFGFTTNTTSAEEVIPIIIEYWDGTEYQTAGTYTINQSSADADITISANPSTIAQFSNAASSVDVVITANKAISLSKAGASTDWFSISANSATAGDTTLTISVTAQAVAASERSGSVVIKNPVSGSTILTLAISQAAGDAYAISITPTSISFDNDEVNVIKNVEVTANAAWYIEEVISN